MRRVLIHVAIAFVLVAVGWAVGRAQTRLGDFEIEIDAPGGSTRIECVRGCSLIGSRDVGNPRAERLRKYSVLLLRCQVLGPGERVPAAVGEMTESAESARRFVQELSGLALRLAGRDLVVSSLHCDWGHFGSWTLEAQRGAAADAYRKALLAEQWDTAGPDVLRVWWDGRREAPYDRECANPSALVSWPVDSTDSPPGLRRFRGGHALRRGISRALGAW